jgi:hypothetical protein
MLLLILKKIFMKSAFNILFMSIILLPAGRQNKNVFPAQSANSGKTAVRHFSNATSHFIRIINASTLKRIPAVVRDLSVALTESMLPEQFLSEKKGLTIYLYDVTCPSFEISAAVQFPHNDTMYHVKLNRFNQQATDMALAATLIHEIMHCVLTDIYKRAHDQEQKAIDNVLSFGLERNDSTNINDNDFFRIMNSGNEGQHELMFRLFYPQMVLLLERFAVIHKESFPNKKAAALMMWSGLQNTDAFKKLSNEDKRVIVATILSEKRIDIETN